MIITILHLVAVGTLTLASTTTKPTQQRPTTTTTSSSVTTPSGLSKTDISNDLPQPDFDVEGRLSEEYQEASLANVTTAPQQRKHKKTKKSSALKKALKDAARKGMEAMVELYDTLEPTLKRKGEVLSPEDPGAQLSMFSAPHFPSDQSSRAAYAALYAAKKLKER